MGNDEDILLFLKEAQEKGLILKKSRVSEKKLLNLLKLFSENPSHITKDLLSDCKSLIFETIEDVRNNYFKLGQIYKEIKKED